jgi:hypothetical protein
VVWSRGLTLPPQPIFLVGICPHQVLFAGRVVGYGQSLDDTAVWVVRDTDDHGYRSLERSEEGIQGSETATFMFLGLPYVQDDFGILTVCNLL